MVTSYPGSKTWSSGNLSSSDMNQYVRDIILWGYEDRPKVWASRTEAQGAQPVSSASDTAIVWGEVGTGWETPSTWWTSGANLTVPHDGIYLIHSRTRIEANATGYRQVRHNVNGSFRNVMTEADTTASVTLYLPMTSIEECNAGDTITLSVYHTAGTSLDIGNSVGSSHSLGMQVIYLMEAP